jgi:hypothetical protein
MAPGSNTFMDPRPLWMRKALKRFFAHFPTLDKYLRHWYLVAVYWLVRERGFRFVTDPRVKLLNPWEWAEIPAEKGEWFFGYYDKTPWPSEMTRLLTHILRKPSARTVEIAVIDREQHSCTIIGHSRAWNFQQGSMTGWLPDGRVIFNDVENDLLVARIVTTGGKCEAVIPYPVQTVHPSGREALGLNYRRLYRLRRDYGYAVPVKNFSPDQAVDKDGIWHIDLQSGKGELMLTLAELLNRHPVGQVNPALTKVNHFMVSPSGKRCAFMHRWVVQTTRYSRLFVMDWNGEHLKLLLDSDLISHFFWRDEDTLICFCRAEGQRERYVHINTTSGAITSVGGGQLDPFDDGHPSYAPGGRWIVTDTYPDLKYQQQIVLLDTATNEVVRAGRFFHPLRFFSETRCDLHPRWSPDGKWISIDSGLSRKRGSYVVDVAKIVRGR